MLGVLQLFLNNSLPLSKPEDTTFLEATQEKSVRSRFEKLSAVNCSYHRKHQYNYCKSWVKTQVRV